MGIEKIFSVITSLVTLGGLVGLFVMDSSTLLLYAAAGYVLLSLIQFVMGILAPQSFVVDAIAFILGFLIGNLFDTPSWVFGCVVMIGFAFLVNIMNVFTNRE